MPFFGSHESTGKKQKKVGCSKKEGVYGFFRGQENEPPRNCRGGLRGESTAHPGLVRQPIRDPGGGSDLHVPDNHWGAVARSGLVPVKTKNLGKRKGSDMGQKTGKKKRGWGPNLNGGHHPIETTSSSGKNWPKRKKKRSIKRSKKAHMKGGGGCGDKLDVG